MTAQALAVARDSDRYDLSRLSDDDLLFGTRRLVGASNQLFADLLAHLAEVEARGIHRLRLCASLYTYCIYELRLSEDAAFRRVSAARLVKTFPALFDAVASGELHLTGLLMIGPHLTHANQVEVLARAKHRTKKELAKLIRQIDPLPNVPARIEPLGAVEGASAKPLRKPTYEEFVTSLNPVRDLPAGERPRDWIDEAALDPVAREIEPALARDDLAAEGGVESAPARSDLAADDGGEPAPARNGTNDGSYAAPAPARNELTQADDEAHGEHRSGGGESIVAQARRLRSEQASLAGPQRYSVQFTAREEYVELVERAKALLSHTSASCSIEELHLRAMQALVEQLEKRKYAVSPRVAEGNVESEEPCDVQGHLGAVGDRSAAAKADLDSGTKPGEVSHADGMPEEKEPAELRSVCEPEPPRQRGRYVPARIRRAVYVRDAARCTFVDARGERCQETHWLELHHLQPFDKGGPHCLENLTLRCRAHNALSAERDFGRAHVQRKEAEQRHESLRRQCAQ